MHVALLTPEYPPTQPLGGIGATTATVAEALSARGHRVTVVAPGPCEDRHDGTVAVLRRPVFPRRAEPEERRASQSAIGDLCERVAPDLVHAPEWKAHAAEVARRGRLPVVTRLDTPTHVVEELNGTPASRDSTWVRAAEREQVVRSRAVFAPSTSLARRAEEDWLLPARSVRVIPNPVAIDSVEACRRPASDRRTIVFFGRVERRKGAHVFSRALPDVLARHRDVQAVFVGADRRTPAMRTNDETLLAPFAPRVHRLGELPRREALELVAGATLVAMPSLWENFPNAALEAMVLGRPVLATRTGGFTEMIRDGVDGILVEPGDAAAITRAMCELLADPDRARSLGASAAREAQRFDEEVVVAELEALYEHALS